MEKHFYIIIFICMRAYGQNAYYVKDTVSLKTAVPGAKAIDKLSSKAVVTFRDAPAAKYAFDTYNSVYGKTLPLTPAHKATTRAVSCCCAISFAEFSIVGYAAW